MNKRNQDISERLQKEFKEINEIYPDLHLKKNEDNQFYYCEGSLKYGRNRYNLKIIYPQLFPYLRPRIYVLEDGQILKDFETSHQLRDGSLCIFTYDNGPNGWKWHYTIQDIIDKFKAFLADREKPEFEITHSSFFSRYYGIKLMDRIVIVPEKFKEFILKNKKGRFTAEKLANKGLFYLLKNIRSMRKNKYLPNEWRNISTDSTTSIDGLWFYIPEAGSRFRYIKDNNGLVKYLKRKIKVDLTQQRSCFPVIICYKLEKIGRYSLVGYSFKANNKNYLKQPPLYFDVDFVNLRRDIFKRTKDVIGKGLEILNQKTVIGVGLGSIGSEIMLELVKSGVGSFILYDPDIVEFSNLTKHACNADYLGMNKAEAVKYLLIKRNPLVNVQSYNQSPLHEVQIQQFIRYLKKKKVIVVVSTAEHETEGAINRLAIENDTPTIYTTALDNAFYGRIFRVLPKKTPCYECIATWNQEDPETFPSLTKENVEEVRNLGEFNAYRHPGFPGISTDVKFISTLASRLTLQTLLRNTESTKIYPDTTTHHYIWSNRKGWIFDNPLRLKTIDYPINENCPVCGNVGKEGKD